MTLLPIYEGDLVRVNPAALDEIYKRNVLEHHPILRDKELLKKLKTEEFYIGTIGRPDLEGDCSIILFSRDLNPAAVGGGVLYIHIKTLRLYISKLKSNPLKEPFLIPVNAHTETKPTYTQSCPLCGSLGQMMFTHFECSNNDCSNHI